MCVEHEPGGRTYFVTSVVVGLLVPTGAMVDGAVVVRGCVTVGFTMVV